MTTIENWENFIRYYGGIVGARDCFELVCYEFLRLENPQKDVHRIKASRGDGGIDIYVGDDATTEIYQCKFFVDNLNPSRWNQIRESLKKVLEQKELSISAWYLCVPKEFTKDEIVDVEKFRKEFSYLNFSIKFIDGNELITRIQNVGIGEKWFSPIKERVLSSYYPRLIPEYIPRSEKEMLLESILSTHNNYLITGIGGIGKTTFLEDLFAHLNAKYDVSIWIDYNTDLQTSFSSIIPGKYTSYEDFLKILGAHFRQKDGQRNIVFIDNVSDNYLRDKTRHFLEGQAQIVLTSRLGDISGYNTFEIGKDSDENIIGIFSKYYGSMLNNDEKEIILEIAQKYEGNILLIEMIAKAAKKSINPLKIFLEKMLKEGITTSNIKVQNRRENTYVDIKNNLIYLYHIGNFGTIEKEILSNFSLIDSIGISDDLVCLYNFHEVEFSDLIEYGWIQKKPGRYFMHPLVRECVKNQIRILKEPYRLTKNVLKNRELYKDELKVYEKRMLFDIILHLLKEIELSSEEDVYILYNLICLIDFFGFSDSLDDVVGLSVQTLEGFEKSLERARVGADIFNVAGLAYLSFDKSKAIVCFLCEQQLLNEFFSNNKKANAICQGNTALALIGIDNGKAREMLFETLKLQSRIYGESSTEVADVLHNIGRVFFDEQRYKKAIKYFEKSLKIKLEKCPFSYTTVKTEFALANAKSFLIVEPFLDCEIQEVCNLYVSVLEKYQLLNNIEKREYINTLQIISSFFKRVGRKYGGEKLDEIIAFIDVKG